LRKTLLVVAITALAGFIGYGVWDVTSGRIPLLSYTMEAEKIVRVADQVTKQHKQGGVAVAQLKTASTDLRAQFNMINSRCNPQDRKRPSWKRIEGITDQVEAAAEKPDSRVILDARMATVEELVKELKEILGKDADKPAEP
jgi:hypothetical protein